MGGLQQAAAAAWPGGASRLQQARARFIRQASEHRSFCNQLTSELSEFVKVRTVTNWNCSPHQGTWKWPGAVRCIPILMHVAPQILA